MQVGDSYYKRKQSYVGDGVWEMLFYTELVGEKKQ